MTELMKGIAAATGAELSAVPAKAAARRGLKQIGRICEKAALRPGEGAGKAERVCDIVRDMILVSSMAQMARAVEALLGCAEIAVVRVKDRLTTPSSGGWRRRRSNPRLA